MTTISVEGKAQLYRDRMLYRTIPATVDAILVTSPTSGQTYRIEASGRCSCPAGASGRLCYHVVALEQEYGSVDAALADLTRTELPAFLAAMEAAKPAPVRPVISATTRDLDFG